MVQFSVEELAGKLNIPPRASRKTVKASGEGLSVTRQV
jgi:hypothetical protein